MVAKKRIVLVCFYDRICLGVRYLSARLRDAGHKVSIIFLKEDRVAPIATLQPDSTQYQMLWLDKFWGSGIDVSPVSEAEWALFGQLLEDLSPDMVGVSARSVHRRLARETARHVRCHCPDAALVAGGYGPSLEPESFLNDFDYVCLGEGDEVIVSLAETNQIDKVPNIAFLRDGRMAFNEILPPVDISTGPYPDWRPDDKYMVEDDQCKTGTSFYDPQTYDIFASRGCPSNCTYCLACHWDAMLAPFGASFPKVRIRTPESVIDELIWAKDRFHIKQVRFKDDIFGVQEDWLQRFLALYERKIGLEFHCLQDPRHANRKKARWLAEAGLDKTTVGIQSADEGIRRQYFKRPIGNERLLEYAHMLLDVGIQLKYDLIGWNPFETNETLQNGMQLLQQMPKSTETAVFELKMFPGSPIRAMYEHERPAGLSEADYTYWAILYQMALFSTETCKTALQLTNDPARSLPQAMAAFRQGQERRFGQFRVVSTAEIGRGRQLTGRQIDMIESTAQGIAGNHYYNVIGMKTARQVPAGKLIQWEDLLHSYQGVRERGSHAV